MNVILVSGSVVVVLQLITRSDSRYIAMFMRLCSCGEAAGQSEV